MKPLTDTGTKKGGAYTSLRKLQELMGYKSHRSTVLLLQELSENGFVEKRDDGTYKLLKDLGNNNRTVSIPLVGDVACGTPIMAEENIRAMIPISTMLARPGSKYFLLKAKGDSMDAAGINDGDLILVRQQQTANNDDLVVALIDDEATVKEFYYKGDFVTLLPRSTNPKHQPIILTREFQIQGVVITAIPNICSEK